MGRTRNLSDFADTLINRISHNFDNIVVLDSGSVKGTGKSTFAMELSQEICKKLGIKFDLEKSVVLDPSSEKIIELVKNEPDGFPIIIDEAGRVAYKRNWAKEYQKDLVVFLNVCRKHHKIIFLNHPDFWELDSDVRNLADYRVTIIRRGVAIVRGKVSNPEAKDKWLRDESQDAMKQNRNQMKVDIMVSYLRKMSNFLFEVHFRPMESSIYNKYEEMSKKIEVDSFLDSKGKDIWEPSFRTTIGIIKFFKDQEMLPKDFSWNLLCQVINKALMIKGIPGALSESRVRKIAMAEDSMNIPEVIREKLDTAVLRRRRVSKEITNPIHTSKKGALRRG